jgi:RNA-directed DNA polymerase
MNGREKSDPAVVAVKLANKTERPVAEAAERRAGAKGNAGQQSTRRTQNRERVSQALDRVRQAARRGRRERFTALLGHVNVDALRLAFDTLRRDAASGVDGVTRSDYDEGLESRLQDLHRRIHSGAYRPRPATPALDVDSGARLLPPSQDIRCRLYF